MKLNLSYLIFLVSYVSFAQNISSGASKDMDNSIVQTISNLKPNNGILYAKNSVAKPVSGQTHLFKDWNNEGRIYFNNKGFSIKNINLNLQTNNFECKFGRNRDSLYVIKNNAEIDSVYINNKKFISYYFPEKGERTNLDVIYEGDDFQLLKGYELDIIKKDPDPLMFRKNEDKYYVVKQYYLKSNNDIEKISVKKKKILGLFTNKSKAVANFAKENKLSFKNDNDLRKIFEYYSTL